MGYTRLDMKLLPDYREEDLQAAAIKKLGINQAAVHVEGKSLDARNKRSIHWHLRLLVLSPELPGDDPPLPPTLEIPFSKRKKRVVVVGSGPAGFFAGLVLQRAGFPVTLLERGGTVGRRAGSIAAFEKTGLFDPRNNYAFGEGGAGTFSDGKLTSRSKHISKERRFILSLYRAAGAPEDIEYLAHPHLGTDRLGIIVSNLRTLFLNEGGRILFDTMLEDLRAERGRVTGLVTTAGILDVDHCIIAPGNAAFDTWRMLMARGVPFRTKPFALGTRLEHPQEIINRAQWGVDRLPGITAAEYRLTSKGDGHLPVYTFCMCPGGTVVPATAFAHTNIVNGMSRYARDGAFANAACVAGLRLEQLTGRDMAPEEALDWLEDLEESFYRFSGGYRAPYCRISDFMNKHETITPAASSYPLGLAPAPLRELLPTAVSSAIFRGLEDFCRKIKGFDTGIMVGLESKSSSPLQALRDNRGRSPTFNNLYIVGEGSGWSGGILSSAADGIKSALDIAALP